jgi:hypothetical protein
LVVTEGVTVTVPEVALPVEKPVPVQEVAFVELHVSVEDWPLVIEVGLAERDAVGGGTVPTVTVALAVPVPPAPVQETLYICVAVGDIVAVPDMPEAVKPVPVQLMAFVELHVSVEDWPMVMEVGLAESVTLGGVTPVVVSHAAKRSLLGLPELV